MSGLEKGSIPFCVYLVVTNWTELL